MVSLPLVEFLAEVERFLLLLDLASIGSSSDVMGYLGVEGFLLKLFLILDSS